MLVFNEVVGRVERTLEQQPPNIRLTVKPQLMSMGRIWPVAMPSLIWADRASCRAFAGFSTSSGGLFVELLIGLLTVPFSSSGEEPRRRRVVDVDLDICSKQQLEGDRSQAADRQCYGGCIEVKRDWLTVHWKQSCPRLGKLSSSENENDRRVFEPIKSDRGVYALHRGFQGRADIPSTAFNRDIAGIASSSF